jgi:transposase
MTPVETTDAAVTAVTLTEPIPPALTDQPVAPDEHLVAAGDVDATLLGQRPRAFPRARMGPVPTDSSGPAKAEHADDLRQLPMDGEAPQGTWPRGTTRSAWRARRERWNHPVIRVPCADQDGRDGEARQPGPKAKTTPRPMTLKPQDEPQALPALRQQHHTAAWQATSATRAGGAGPLSPGVRAVGWRHGREVGLANTRLPHLATAAAIHIDRLAAWLDGRPHSNTRTSRVAALAA